MQAAFYQHRHLAGHRELYGSFGRGVTVRDRLDRNAIERNLRRFGRCADLRLGSDQQRIEQTLVPNLDRGQNGVRRARVHDRGPDGRHLSCFFDECFVVIMASERDIGKLGPRPFNLSVRSDHRRDAGQDLIALMVRTDGVQEYDALFRPFLLDRYRDRDGVAGCDRPAKSQALLEIDRAWSGQLGAEHSGHQRARPHAVRNNVTKEVGGCKGRVQMRRIYIAGDGRKQVDVVSSDDPYQRGRITNLQFIERPISEECLFHCASPLKDIRARRIVRRRIAFLRGAVAGNLV